MGFARVAAPAFYRWNEQFDNNKSTTYSIYFNLV